MLRRFGRLYLCGDGCTETLGGPPRLDKAMSTSNFPLPVCSLLGIALLLCDKLHGPRGDDAASGAKGVPNSRCTSLHASPSDRLDAVIRAAEELRWEIDDAQEDTGVFTIVTPNHFGVPIDWIMIRLTATEHCVRVDVRSLALGYDYGRGKENIAALYGALGRVVGTGAATCEEAGGSTVDTTGSGS